MKALRIAVSLFSLSLACYAVFTPRDSNAQTPSILGEVTTQVVSGAYHACTLTTAGAVKCWGYNASGELGDDSTAESHVPVAVHNLTSGVVAIAAGDYHTCALTTAGAVKCWGYNHYGQLGNNSTTESHVPVDVSGLGSGVAAITAGENHTCALSTTGAVKCWGENNDGQLGNNTYTNSLVPVDVTYLNSVLAIAAGKDHTCALTTPDLGFQESVVLCWGSNVHGQLGNDSTVNSNLRKVVRDLGNDVTAIAAGDFHSCAVTTAGGVKCWGDNNYGQLGNGSTAESHLPVAVSGLASGVTAITAGSGDTCALTTAGALRCWGSNGSGQLGNNTQTGSDVPVPVSGLGEGVAAITAGNLYTCALTTLGGVLCWGTNGYGQLGNNSTTISHVPTPVSDLASGVATITAGNLHSCALTKVGGVQCWGDNTNGQLGNGSTSSLPTPTPADVSGLISGVTTIAAGAYHTCARTTAGGVQCWGYNHDGQLGNGSAATSPTPVDVSGLASGVIGIAEGAFHTCALTSTHGVKCWGNNQYGGLGNGSTSYLPTSTPVDVSSLASGVMAITAGVYHTCALTTIGGVKCWGYNHYGQLGNASKIDSSTPVDVTGLTSGVMAITAGPDHTCALMMTGTIKCWGDNQYGELGNGSTIDSSTPVDVSTLTSGVTTIMSAPGSYHTCALLSAGAIKCWGSNSNGELGDGSTTQRLIPVAVSNLSSGVKAIAAGDGHTCALTSADKLLCWGRNGNGQLGDGSTTPRLTPVDIRDGQSIAFHPSLANAMGATFTLTATATNGDAVSFDIWTPGICSISGDSLSISPTAPEDALCGVRASQPGGTRAAGGSDTPAPQQLRLIRISEFIFNDGFEILGLQ